jgi:hypothetical protein
MKVTDFREALAEFDLYEVLVKLEDPERDTIW